MMPTVERPRQLAAVRYAVGIHVLRLVVIAVVLLIAPYLGIRGWYAGFATNVVLAAVAVGMMTHQRLWRSTGMTTAWRSGLAALALVPFVLEMVAWTTPDGIRSQSPGYGWWALSMLLVGLNEELFSRALALSRLTTTFRPLPAAAITAALFGLQHLSALVFTSRGAVDVLTNVLASAAFGFALAAHQLRFAWLWVLVLVHAVADWTTILAADQLSDAIIAIWYCAYVGYGLVLLRKIPSKRPTITTRAP